MVNRKLAFGFDRWITAFAPRDDPMSKALLYLLNRELARGWTAWYETWEVLKAKRESMRKSLGHLLHRGLSRGLSAWMEILEERAAFLQLLSKGVRFMLNRKLAFGFVSWAQAIDRTLRQAEGSGHMSRAFLYFKNRHLARGWTAWHAEWADSVAARTIMRKSLGHLLNRGLSRGFGAWLEMAIERAVFLQKLRKGLSRMVNRKLAFGFDRWIAAFAPRDDPMPKALLYFLNRGLSRGWVAWYTTWEELKAKRESMRKCLSHMLYQNPPSLQSLFFQFVWVVQRMGAWWCSLRPCNLRKK